MSNLETLLRGGLVTLEVASLSWLVAVGAGLVLALVREDASAVRTGSVEFMVVLLRGAPQLVVAYVLFFGLGQEGLSLSALAAAVLALGITEGGFAAEYFRGALLSVPAGQRDAGKALGLSRLQTMVRVVLPQAVPTMIPSALNIFVALLKTATLASALGVPEILYEGQKIENATGDIVLVSATLVIVYLVFTIPLNLSVSWLERKIRGASSSGAMLADSRF